MENNNRGRIFYFFLLICLLFFVYKLAELQIFNHSRYAGFAEENAARITPIRAPRGIIYDRSGRVIVQNRPVFSLFLFPEKVGDLDAVLTVLSKKLNLSFEELKKKVSKSTAPSYEGIRIANKLSSIQVSGIKESADQLQGTRIVVSPLREYPYKNVGIHLLGYIGEINQKELAAFQSYGYRMHDLIGKDGIEKQYDKYLRGVAGGEKMEVDVYGRPIRMIESLNPVPGNNLKLTIDQEMQKAVEEIMGQRNGAVVVLDPNNGEVLAMVSRPSYDPTKPWGEIDQRNHPFMNRALSPVPPGSIFKPAVLQAAIDNNIFSPDEMINCKGYIKIGRRFKRCWRSQGHGTITFREGLVWSCDVAFYELGKRLGVDKISAYAKKFGLGVTTGIDLPREKKGLVPGIEWKQKYYRQPWFPGDTLNYAIGQGYLLVTPLQMASFFGEIAVGRRFKPHVVAEIKTPEGKIIYSAEPELLSSNVVSYEVTQALREVVRRATGVVANVPGLPAAGKTGTAENPGKAHAWFCSYAPNDKPEIAMAVFIEHGEHGDRAPAEVTREILKWYKKFRLKREIPAEKPTYQYILHGDRIQWLYPKWMLERQRSSFEAE
ncbi:MAG: penicillin-binding protein 2 [Candidatus Saganbacteria bacterium]|nr:penicillin-binding protein 2 [Candidatus Saganbacteria bacterium]